MRSEFSFGARGQLSLLPTMSTPVRLPLLLAFLVALLCAAALRGGPALAEDSGKGSDIGGPEPESLLHRTQFGVDAGALTDAEKEARLDVIAKEYEGLKRNQDILPTRTRRNRVRFVGEMRYPAAAKFLEGVFDGDRDTRTQVAAMVAIGQSGDMDAIQSVVKKSLASAKKDPVFASSLPRMFRFIRNPEAGKWLASRLDTKDPGFQATLIECVGLAGTREALPAIEKLVAQGNQPVVRFEALRAYGRIGGGAAVSTLLNYLGDPEWRVRMAAAEGLRFAGAPRAIAELRRLIIEGEEPIVIETATEAVGALGLVGDGTPEAIPPLLETLKVGRLRARNKARQSLIALARKLYRQDKDYSVDLEAWTKWWEKVQRGVDPDDPKYNARETGSFYRFKIHSDHVLFILDVSGSMDWPDASRASGIKPGDWNGRRIDLAHRELFRTLKTLDKGTLFSVATFSGAVMSWSKEETYATPENVEAAIAWIRKQLPRGGTATYDALEYGINQTKADTIFFLSDGLPSGGRYEQPETILSEIRRANRFRRVSVNTVALIVGKAPYESVQKYEDPDEMAEFMSRIAEENYGSFADESTR